MYPPELQEIVGLESAALAQERISRWPGYEVSPLHELSGFAARTNVATVFYKDESRRFGLNSFKALGGAYAVAQQLLQIISRETGEDLQMDELFARKHADIVGNITVATATDGNHGRSVAWGARAFGCQCVIYIHADVSPLREKAMADLGAEVRRIEGNYDDSLKEAAQAADQSGWIIVSDNSYEGYLDIPRYVMAGYTVMLAEVVTQLQGNIPTHVLVQGGCGGLAAAVSGYFWDLWGKERPRLVVVEAEKANCLQLSVLAGELVVVGGQLETMMAGLACGEVSPLAWDILSAGADDFITLPERYVAESMRMLARGEGDDPSVEAGESAVAGAGTLIAVAADDSARNALGLNGQSSVLVLGTEGATDPDLYEKIISTDFA